MTIYGTLAKSKTYHSERGNTAWAAGSDDDLNAALLRASECLDGRYESMFPGDRTDDRAQDRAWPRKGTLFGIVADWKGNDIDDDVVPIEVERATYEIALRELATPGVMQPDVKKSDRRKRVRVEGAVSVEYAGANSVEDYRTIVTIVDAILAPILTGDGASSRLGGKGVRV